MKTSLKWALALMLLSTGWPALPAAQVGVFLLVLPTCGIRWSLSNGAFSCGNALPSFLVQRNGRTVYSGSSMGAAIREAEVRAAPGETAVVVVDF